MYGGDEVSALVIDIGTTNSKAGYAGEDTPKAVFPTSVGVLYSGGKDNTVGSGPTAVGEEAATEVPVQPSASSALARTFYIGTGALSYKREKMDITNPLEKGLVHDWDVIEQLWDHIFKARLKVDPKEHPILHAEVSFNTREIREKYTEIMFEKYQVPAMFVAKNAVLASFASGRATSLVLDSGGGITCAVPVYDGYALQKGIVKTTLAGDKLTAIMQRNLERKGATLRPNYAFTKKEVSPGKFEVQLKDSLNVTTSYYNWSVQNLVNDIKETTCRVSDSPFDETTSTSIPTMPYELPDGNMLEVGADRFSVPELLFNPSRIAPGDSAYEPGLVGVPQMVYNSISACDADIRRDLYSGIILTGGTTLIPGFSERVTKELNDIAPAQMYKLKVLPSPIPVERKFGVWIGGSILASLGSFQQMWMSRSEYDEHGATLVERKCP